MQQYAQRVFSTRGGTFTLAGLAALLAAATVFAYVRNYRHNVQKGGAHATVLVAKTVIHQGTSGEAIANQHLYYQKQLRESQLREGAVSDIGSLRGKVAASDILGDQQLTAADFTAGAKSLAGKLV